MRKKINQMFIWLKASINISRSTVLDCILHTNTPGDCFTKLVVNRNSWSTHTISLRARIHTFH